MRLIDADALKQADFQDFSNTDVLCAIDEAPTVDAVPVVRCVECKHYNTVGCFYCRGIESHGIVAVKTVINEYLKVIPAYDTPYNFCPNCGRKIKKD